VIETVRRSTRSVAELGAWAVLVPPDDALLDLGLAQLGMPTADTEPHHLLCRLAQVEGDLHALGDDRVGDGYPG